MPSFTDPETWIAFLTLTFLEIVLGVDNIIFISILSGKLPSGQQRRARRLGLIGAMLTRVLLLFSLAWIVKLTTPLVTLINRPISGRDLILIGGGLFLLGKSTFEMHERLEGEQDHTGGRRAASFVSVIVQIMLLDIVFSLDSVITAVGMVDEVAVMVAAVIVSAGIMMLSAESISAFVHKHPTVKMLALSFLLLIGMSLLLEGFGQHIPKGYIYFAMGFSVFVEMINLRIRAKSAPVRLRERYADDEGGPRLKRIPGARRLLEDCRTVLNRCLFPEDFATMKRLSVALFVACLATVPLVAQQPAASPSTQPRTGGNDLEGRHGAQLGRVQRETHDGGDGPGDPRPDLGNGRLRWQGCLDASRPTSPST